MALTIRPYGLSVLRGILFVFCLFMEIGGALVLGFGGFMATGFMNKMLLYLNPTIAWLVITKAGLSTVMVAAFGIYSCLRPKIYRFKLLCMSCLIVILMKLVAVSITLYATNDSEVEKKVKTFFYNNTEIMTDLQMTLRCCGKNDYKDYSKLYVEVQDNPSTLVHVVPITPYSCHANHFLHKEAVKEQQLITKTDYPIIRKEATPESVIKIHNVSSDEANANYKILDPFDITYEGTEDHLNDVVKIYFEGKKGIKDLKKYWGHLRNRIYFDKLDVTPTYKIGCVEMAKKEMYHFRSSLILILLTVPSDALVSIASACVVWFMKKQLSRKRTGTNTSTTQTAALETPSTYSISINTDPS